MDGDSNKSFFNVTEAKFKGFGPILSNSTFLPYLKGTLTDFVFFNVLPRPYTIYSSHTILLICEAYNFCTTLVICDAHIIIFVLLY